MTLAEFIEEQGIALTRFAKKAGITYSQAYHAKRGVTPTLPVAIKIERYTKGLVTCAEMISHEDLQNDLKTA